MDKLRKKLHQKFGNDEADASPSNVVDKAEMTQDRGPEGLPQSQEAAPIVPPHTQVYSAGPPPPHSNANQSTAQNAGMLGGAILGPELGTNTGMGMVDGMVVGGLINQRINQQHKSNYWREQEAQYNAGVIGAEYGGANAIAASKHPSRDARRAERRRNRWDKRAKRRGEGKPSGSDSSDSSGGGK